MPLGAAVDRLVTHGHWSTLRHTRNADRRGWHRDLILAASRLLNPHPVGDRLFGNVAAVLVTTEGDCYPGVCIDTGSGTGFCAEHAAVAAMVTADEYRIAAIVAVWRDDWGQLFVLPPCGRCREFLRQGDPANLLMQVVRGDQGQHRADEPEGGVWGARGEESEGAGQDQQSDDQHRPLPEVAPVQVGWCAAAESLARGIRDLVTAHPWSVLAGTAYPTYGPAAARLADHSIAIFEAAGFTGDEADWAVSALFAYVQGMTAGHAAWGARIGSEGVDEHAYAH